jgi:hypothetical protein
MTRAIPRWRVGRVLASALLALAFVLSAGGGVAWAADASFGTAEATVTYAESIEFTEQVTTTAPLERVELRLRYPATLGPAIIDVPIERGSGSQQLRYVMDLTDGGPVPNTTFTATWAAFPADGADPVLSQPLSVSYRDTSHEWQTIKGDLVTVHWYQGPRSFAERQLEIGEQALRDANALLGVTDTTPVDFFIYGDQGSFVTALGPGTRETTVGTAFADIRTMFGLISPDTLDQPQVAAAVAHELVHLVFATATDNPYRRPPLWLNEGLAVYLTEGYTDQRRSLVEEAVRSGNLFPLDALGGRFPADLGQVFLAYCEGASAIDHLVRTDGRDALVALVQAYKDGLTDDEAFTKALGRDLAAFQAGWLKELGAEQPEQYGPQPAPAGPVPPGWDAAAQSPAPGSTPGAANPSAPATAAPAAVGGSGGELETGAVLAAILAVVAVIVIALVVARRRAGPV